MSRIPSYWSSCRAGAAPVGDPSRKPGAASRGGASEPLRRAIYPDQSEGVLFALARAVEQRDRQTAGHCERLAFISVALGMALKLNRNELAALYRGGYLHDIGKVGIPDSILFKPGKLTADEWETMRSHTTRGEEICRPLGSLRPALPVIRHHHERWDGGGYPDGLRGEQIPLGARLLQIADIYDALISARPYKQPYSAQDALKVIEEETAAGWRDPQIAELFFRLHKSVVGKIAYGSGAGPDTRPIRSSLDNLQRLLNAG